jgi:hypothetical protein
MAHLENKKTVFSNLKNPKSSFLANEGYFVAQRELLSSSIEVQCFGLCDIEAVIVTHYKDG